MNTQEMREIWEEHEDINALCNEIDRLQEQNKIMREALEDIARHHLHLDEDCWYSCPAHPEYCGPDDSGECCCSAGEAKNALDKVKDGPETIDELTDLRIEVERKQSKRRKK